MRLVDPREQRIGRAIHEILPDLLHVPPFRFPEPAGHYVVDRFGQEYETTIRGRGQGCRIPQDGG